MNTNSLDTKGGPFTVATARSGLQKATFPPAQREFTSTATWESIAVSSQFKLSAMAQHCQVSLRTLQRHFRKHYNVAVSEWMRNVRLERARTLLATAESVKSVAFDLGYKQPSHFTRDFKQHFGVPPSACLVPDSVSVRVSRFSEADASTLPTVFAAASRPVTSIARLQN